MRGLKVEQRLAKGPSRRNGRPERIDIERFAQAGDGLGQLRARNGNAVNDDILPRDGPDQRALGEIGSDLGELLAGPLDRREIGRSGVELRRVSRGLAQVVPGVGGDLPVRGLRAQQCAGGERLACL